jgi:hypothetical protein
LNPPPNITDPLVLFMPSGKRGRFPRGTTVLDAARELGVNVEIVCGGRDTCGRCQVVVQEGSFAKHKIVSSSAHISPKGAREERYESVRGLGGGVAGHNGLRSLAAHLGSPDFKRVRLGIGHPGHKDRVIDHVLSDAPQRNPATIESATLERRYDISLWNLDPERTPWVVQAFEKQLDNIRALRRMAEDQDAVLVLITDGIPHEGLHGRLREFLATEIPHHLDVARPMAEAAQGRRIRYHHDPHWNALGNRLAAEIIHRYLREAGLL